MVRDLLRLRREDPVFRAQRPGGVDGAVLGPARVRAALLRAAGHDEDRLLIVNLGADLPLSAAPDRLLAPPAGRRWALAWSTEDPRYGGQGAPCRSITDDGIRPSRRSRRRPHPNAMTHIRRLQAGTDHRSRPSTSLDREWLVTNGLGGYASGTIAGVITRRYHGLLTAALPAPLGRTVMLSHLAEELVWADGRRCRLTGTEHTAGITEFHAVSGLKEFRVEDGLPVWRYEFAGVELEKRLLMPHQQNTVHVSYRVLVAPPRSPAGAAAVDALPLARRAGQPAVRRPVLPHR